MSAVTKAGNDNDNINDNDETTINLEAKVKDEIEGNEQNGELYHNNNNKRNLMANNLLPTFSIICRICLNNDQPERLQPCKDTINELLFDVLTFFFVCLCFVRLISPCICKGTLAYVHRSCLEHWLGRSATRHCELCLYDYRFTEILRLLNDELVFFFGFYYLKFSFCRYQWWQALRIWYRNSRNRNMLQVS
jgi:hypothetical protein